MPNKRALIRPFILRPSPSTPQIRRYARHKQAGILGGNKQQSILNRATPTPIILPFHQPYSIQPSIPQLQSVRSLAADEQPLGEALPLDCPQKKEGETEAQSTEAVTSGASLISL